MAAGKSSDFRVFVGLALPPALRAQLALMQEGLSHTVKRTDPADLHITLAFLGGLDAGQLRDLDEALAGLHARAFDLALTGAGYFSGGHGLHHLWMGVAENAPLHALKSKVDRALESYGLPFEHRKFTPHVTLARLKPEQDAEAGVFIAQHNLFASAPFRVENVTLFRSHLDSPPLRYEVLEEYPLI